MTVRRFPCPSCGATKALHPGFEAGMYGCGACKAVFEAVVRDGDIETSLLDRGG